MLHLHLDGLVDAQEMARTHPETFSVPSHAEMDAVGPGDLVKICRGEERFWVVATDFDLHYITGAVANRLVGNIDLEIGQFVTFERRHVYDVEAGTMPLSDYLAQLRAEAKRAAREEIN